MFSHKTASPWYRFILLFMVITALQGCGPPYQVINDDFRGLKAARGTKRYNQKWAKIQKAEDEARYEKAQRLTSKIFKKAQRQNNPIQIIKSLRKRQDLQSEVEALKPEFTFQTLKALAGRTDFLISSLGNAMLAERYHEAYSGIRQSILKPKQPLPAFSNPLMTSWPAGKFRQAINRAWNEALEPRDQLSRLYAGVFQPLLTGDTALRSYRPSLFDLLAYKAISYYKKGDGLSYTKGIDYQEGQFALPKTFTRTDFDSLRGDQAYKRCLTIFQGITQAHYKDSIYKALVHSSLNRLRFSYKHVALPETAKAKLYYQGLDSLIQYLPATGAKAMALFRKAQLLKQGTSPPDKQRFSPISKAVSLCKKAMGQYANTPGAKRCRKLHKWLTAPSMQLTVQKRYLPGQPGRMRLSYKNMDSLYYRFIPIATKLKHRLEGLAKDKLLKKLLQKPSAYRLKERLPLYTIYDSTSKKIGVPALDPGAYAIVASNKQAITQNKTLVTVNFFQVSNLSFRPAPLPKKRGLCQHVVKANNGELASQVSVRSYKADKQGYLELQPTSYMTDSTGGFCITQGAPEPDYLAAISDGDTLLVPFKSLRQSRNRESLFSPKQLRIEKKVYKPGAKLIFEGSLREMDSLPLRRYKVLNHQSFPTQLIGPSNDTLKTTTVTSNACGLFHDSLTLPYLPGSYQLVTPFSKKQLSIKTEEIHFSLQLATGSKYYPLNQYVKVQGQAKAFKSIQIPQAKIRFKVFRKASFPYSPKPDTLPKYATALIKKGITRADSNGAFRFHFRTETWPGMESHTDAIFRYKIETEVLQPKAPNLKESHIIWASQQKHFLNFHSPQWIRKVGSKRPFIAELRAANGRPVAKKLTLKIFRLKPPRQLYRKQYWPVPEFQENSEKAFHLKFPFDPYDHDPKPLTRQPVADTVWKGKIAANQQWFIPDSVQSRLKPGNYRAKLICEASKGYCQTSTLDHFQVFKGGSGKPALKVFQYLAPVYQTFHPDSAVAVHLGSAARHTNVSIYAKSNDSVMYDTIIALSREQQPLKWHLKDKQNLKVHLSSVHKNRLYQDFAYFQAISKANSPGSHSLSFSHQAQGYTHLNSGAEKSSSSPGAFGIAKPLISPFRKRLTFEPLTFEAITLSTQNRNQ